MTVPLARRNLMESRTRFFMSIGGIALAALLVLVLDGVFAGTQRQVTAYMDNQDFDAVIAQKGVRNLHMTTSFIPENLVRQAHSIDGVADAQPILYSTTFLVAGGENRSIAYLIGYIPGEVGGPWERVSGDIPPKPGEVVIDERLAERWGLSLGDELNVGGRAFVLGGLTSGTVNVVNSIAFVSFSDFRRTIGAPGVVSYVLVSAEPGVTPEELADRLRAGLDDVTVLTRREFANSEADIIGDMSVDIMWIMDLFGFLIGLAVVGLTVYTSTHSKLRDFGVLKALGARPRRLFGVVFRQSAMSVAAGLLLAWGLALAIAALLPAIGLPFSLAITASSLIRVAGSAVVIGVLASAIPVARIAGLKPDEVFRR